MKPRKLKLWAMSTTLVYNLPTEHRSPNGCAQKDVLVRCASRKRLAEILRTTTAHMRLYHPPRDVTGRPEYEAIVVLPERVYYEPERIRTGELVRGYVLAPESTPRTSS